MNAGIEVGRFEVPRELLDTKAQGGIDVRNMVDGAIVMRATLELGQTRDRDEKPLPGSRGRRSMHHAAYCIEGNLVARMVASDTEALISRGDLFGFRADHDRFVPGSDRIGLIFRTAPEAKTAANTH